MCNKGLAELHEACNSGPMTLIEYIRREGDLSCAVLFGVKLRTIGSWRRRERQPRPTQARRIVEATGGAVTMAEIYAEFESEAAA